MAKQVVVVLKSPIHQWPVRAPLELIHVSELLIFLNELTCAEPFVAPVLYPSTLCETVR